MIENQPPEARRKIAWELALCHRLHLLQEEKKSPELLSAMTAEGIPFADHVRDQLRELGEMFPGIEKEDVAESVDPSRNIMREWFDNRARRPGRPPYNESTFKLVNVSFLLRLKYILDPREEVRRELIDTVSESLVTMNFIERGLAFEHLIRIEKAMTRVIEDRLESVQPTPASVYKDVLESLEVTVTSSWFKYYYDLVLDARERSDRLLRNILPAAIADQLKTDEKTPAPLHYDSATIVFTDFVGFSRAAGDIEPTELVRKLDLYFKAYDDIIEKYGLEKLKTIGDSYMFAGGVPEEKGNHALNCVKAALEIRDYMLQAAQSDPSVWPIRIGVHTGPIVAGVIGHKKFSYDIWGDAVNVASRMESTGDPDSVNLSETTKQLVEDSIVCRELGVRSIKNRGEMRMFVAEALK